MRKTLIALFGVVVNGFFELDELDSIYQEILDHHYGYDGDYGDDGDYGESVEMQQFIFSYSDN